MDATTQTLLVEAAWKREAMERCRAFDEGKLSERDAVDVLNDTYRKVKPAAAAFKIENARAGRPCH